jgi:hypothetical protein
VKANLILGLVGSVVTLIVLFEMMRRHRLREKYAVLWVLVALATLVVALFPPVLTNLAELVGVQVPANLLFFLASMLLLMVSVQHSHELSRLENHGRTLAEEVALIRLELEVLTEEQRRAQSDE